MALDPNIILSQSNFQIDSPQQMQAKRFALQQQQNQQDQYQYQLKKQQQTDANDEALKGVFQNSLELGEDGQPRPNKQKLLAGVMQINPELGLKLQQQFAESELKAGNLKNDTAKSELSLKAEKGKYYRDLLATANPQNYQSILQQAQTDGMGFVNGAPQQFDPNWIKQQVMTADKFLESQKPQEYGTGVNYDENNRAFVMDKFGQPKYIGTSKAPDKVNLPSGYEASPDGGIRKMKGYGDDPTLNTYSTKPLPTASLKLQNDALDKLSIATNNSNALATVLEQLDTGKLNLGLLSNLEGKARNFAGLSNESSRNLSSFKSTLEKLRNDSLRLNTGVQTDGDAKRAWNELFENINDQDLVKQRLQEIVEINKRGADLQKLQVESIRSNYNAEPIDFSKYEGGKQNIMGAGEKMPAKSPVTFKAPPNPAQYKGKRMRDDKTGQILQSDGKRWLRVK